MHNVVYELGQRVFGNITSYRLAITQRDRGEIYHLLLCASSQGFLKYSHAKDRGKKVLCRVNKPLPLTMVSYPRRLHSSWTNCKEFKSRHTFVYCEPGRQYLKNLKYLRLSCLFSYLVLFVTQGNK